MISVPWARLIRFITPHMMLNPSATHAYRAPTSIPLMMSWRISIVSRRTSGDGGVARCVRLSESGTAALRLSRIGQLLLGPTTRIDHDRTALLDLDHCHSFANVHTALIELDGTVRGHDVGSRNRIPDLLGIQRTGLLDRSVKHLKSCRGLRRVVVRLVAILSLEYVRVLSSRPPEDLVLPRHVRRPLHGLHDSLRDLAEGLDEAGMGRAERHAEQLWSHGKVVGLPGEQDHVSDVAGPQENIGLGLTDRRQIGRAS